MRRARVPRPALAGLSAWLVLWTVWGARPDPVQAQQPGRETVETLTFTELDFHPPTPVEHRLSNGVTVFFLPDSTLPLVDVYARFSGGWGRFERRHFAAGSALPSLLRRGGTRTRSPDSVSHAMEYLALQTSFGGSGESVTSTLNTLRRHLPEALDLWAEMLREPGFDTAEIAVWRGRELENVRRRTDEPGRLAFAEFNRLLYGDHPVGWEMTVDDLTPERLTDEELHWVHERVLCPGNLLLGVAGDVAWDEIEPLLEQEFASWPECPEPLPPSPAAQVGADPGVYLVPRPVNQSVVVMAHPVSLQQGDTPEYFASRIGNAILGAGGLTSRLMGRIRTEEGLAYGASSVWTTPRRYEGLLGATTRTRTDATARVVRLVRETLVSMTEEPATEDEVNAAVDEWVNGWVFNFESPSRIVARALAFRASKLPDDWLTRYLAGIQAVEPDDVRRVYGRHLRPDQLVILVVGDPGPLREPLEALGPVTVLEPGR
ncbi:MAG: pitrilysin family protein [Gemmatimonadota bacterium]